MLIFQKRHGEIFFFLWNFDKQDDMQLQILYMRFRATLNFRKFKQALNPMYRIDEFAYFSFDIGLFYNKIEIIN